mgnify:CR=1 FL=1
MVRCRSTRPRNSCPPGSETLRWRNGDKLRKIFLDDGRIVGFRLAGDISGAGTYRGFSGTGFLAGAETKPI